MKKSLVIPMSCLMMVLAGCATDAVKGGDPMPSTNSSIQGDSKTRGSSNINSAGAKAGEKGAVNEISNFKCGESNGKWNATWTIKNNTKQETTYRVKVSVTDKNYQVQGEKEQSVKIKPGETKKFSQLEIFKNEKKKKGLQCFPAAYKK